MTTVGMPTAQQLVCCESAADMDVLRSKLLALQPNAVPGASENSTWSLAMDAQLVD